MILHDRPLGRDYLVSESWSQATVITRDTKLGIMLDPTAVHRNWDYDKQQANYIAQQMGLGEWSRITDSRKKLILARQREEGIDNPKDFWNAVKEVLVPFDMSKIENWTSGKTLDTFLRIPQRGNVDHYLTAKEGGYRPAGSAEPEGPSPIDELLKG